MQVLAHNLAAQFTNRQLNITTDQKGKSAEKLSSGYRINRSADDAAGLSISEEMRRQIRGLNKGGTNIQEGISLCQIADGALGEVTSILQRMRQLSIQAYNGTNSKSDRACIQDEIDNCLDGINEIQERTKYNELYVLKNNGQVQDVKNVWVDESHMETMTRMKLDIRQKPDWLLLNDGQDAGLNHHYDNFVPDTDGIMCENYKYKDANGDDQYIYLYYGKRQATDQGQYRYIGDVIPELKKDTDLYTRLITENPGLGQYVDQHFVGDSYDGWTPDPKDNLSCKIDFGGLVTNTTTADDLKKNMFGLLGTELGFPCGTCSLTNAIRFSGEMDGYKAYNFEQMGGYWNEKQANLSLSSCEFTYTCYIKNDDGTLQTQSGVKSKGGYIEAINNLYQIEDKTVRNAKAKELAQSIAEDLTVKVKERLEDNMQTHYERVAYDKDRDQDPTKKTVLYVYDYRDTDSLTDQNEAKAKKVQTASGVYSEYTYDALIQEGHYMETPNGNPSIQIQGSATVGDSIPLELRSISTKSLGLDGYNVNRYKRNFIYDDNYKSRLKDYYKKLNDMEYKEVTKTVKGLVMVEPEIVDEKYGYKNGERTLLYSKVISPGKMEEREYQVTILEPKNPISKPIPHSVEVYNPSDLSILDNAMDQVSKMRSYFGASQNRLEHAYAANKNTEENTTAAESRIRDTDMAKEMVGFSKNNILAQVGQSMLAQANQSTQGILSLLQ